MSQDTKTDCGCQPTCCDRHLAPVQTQASACCDPIAAGAVACGCGSAADENPSPAGEITPERLQIEVPDLDAEVCTCC